MGLVAIGTTLRDPISIRSEADLQTSNGVLYGSGSESDPYVISGWQINVQRGIGIEIKDVSAYVVVRDCTVVGNGRAGTGILLRGAPHVQVVNCQLADLAAGVFLYQNAQGSVDRNTISSCRRGIAGTESDGVVLTGNRIEKSAERGLFLWRCHDAIMADNVLLACTDGIYLDSCHRDMLARNRVEGSVHGIFLWDSFNCQATENIVRGCELGFAIVHTSEDNRVFGNTFGENDRAATCDNPQNLWDAGYPEGGNFWGGESFSDVLSGETQDRDGSDGIADQPREIPFGSMDRYPLMQEPPVGGSS
jgi:parallel beta-helix repeat protein